MGCKELFCRYFYLVEEGFFFSDNRLDDFLLEMLPFSNYFKILLTASLFLSSFFSFYRSITTLELALLRAVGDFLGFELLFWLLRVLTDRFLIFPLIDFL